MSVILSPHVELTEVERKSLQQFLDDNKAVAKLIVASNFRKPLHSDDRIPHGTMALLKSNAALLSTMLPKSRGGCVALVEITNYNRAIHIPKLEDKASVQRFVESLGDGPTIANTHIDMLRMHLGRPIKEWNPYLGDGTIGVTIDSNDQQWGKKHYIAVIIPHLPIATEITDRICGQTTKEASSSYLVELLPKIIERNAKKIIGAYANHFGFEVPMEPDQLGPCGSENPPLLPKLANFSYDPTFYSNDGETFICSKILVSASSRAAVLPISPHRGFAVAQLNPHQYLPFGVSSTKSAKIQISAVAFTHFSEIAHWGHGRHHSEFPEKLGNRIYHADKADVFLQNSGAQNVGFKHWESMICQQIKN